MEYIKADKIEYECQTVTTGTDSITFIIGGQTVESIHKAFKDVTELTILGEDKKIYGIYSGLSFALAAVDTDDIVTVTMLIKPDLELRLEKVEISQDIQDGAIVELAGIISGGE